MAVANTLAYNDTATITAIKSFIVQTTETYPREEQLKDTLIRQALALFTNIRLDWKVLQKETLWLIMNICKL